MGGNKSLKLEDFLLRRPDPVELTQDEIFAGFRSVTGG